MVLSLTPGGTEHLVIEICKRLRPQFDFAVCCLDDEGQWAAHLRERGVEVIALGRRPGFRPALARSIARIAADRRCDVLHCHHYSPFVYGRLATMWNRRPALVYTEHGRLSDARPSWKRRLVNPWLSRFDAAFVAVSHELRDHMVDARFPGERVGVIHNGIDAGAVPTPFDRHHARHLLGVDDEAFTVFTVARLDPVKDLLTLLDAFAIVRKQISSSRLVIVGDGPERETLSRRAASPDLSGSVRITGFRSDVRKVLAAADVYVNSSVSEGVSITILEALAARVPVVATAVGGTPEVVSDGSEGMLVPPRAPARMAAAILALAHDPQQRRALGAAGRVRVEDAFTIERMVAEYAALYRTLVD